MSCQSQERLLVPAQGSPSPCLSPQPKHENRCQSHPALTQQLTLHNPRAFPPRCSGHSTYYLKILCHKSTGRSSSGFRSSSRRQTHRLPPHRPTRGSPLPLLSRRCDITPDLHDARDRYNKFVSPRKDHAWDSSDDDDGLDEEDKTVTARPRKGPFTKHSPPPPMPSLPLTLESVGETFPGSPTLSVFSIPPSGCESVNTYSSLAHLPLRGVVNTCPCWHRHTGSTAACKVRRSAGTCHQLLLLSRRRTSRIHGKARLLNYQ
jgi:hypothetical protein